jgi:hypothetical protein
MARSSRGGEGGEEGGEGSVAMREISVRRGIGGKTWPAAEPIAATTGGKEVYRAGT